MEIKYYWDFTLEEMSEMTTNPILTSFFIKKRDEALAIIEGIDKTPLSESVGQLNKINQQLGLLFLSITENVVFFDDPKEIIRTIEKEYVLDFFDGVSHPICEYDYYSFLYLMAPSKHPLIWELDIEYIAFKIFNRNSEYYVNDLPTIITYYKNQQSIARGICKILNANNFRVLFPKLLVIDWKCRTLVDIISMDLFYIERAWEIITMLEEDIIENYESDFVYPPTPISKYSLRRQIK